MSDHLPVLTLLKQTKFTDKKSLEFKNLNLNPLKIAKIRSKLFKIDWIGVLNKRNCDEKFNIFSERVNAVMDDVSPEKTVKILHKHKYVEPWMSHGIEIANRKGIKLYKKSIDSNITEDDIIKYKEIEITIINLKEQHKQLIMLIRLKSAKAKLEISG